MKIAVIIPVYNGEKIIGRCLKALKNQEFDGDYEIIVVDDGSTDGTSNVVKEFNGVKLIRNDRRMGPSFARNRGAMATDADVLVFVDADCEPAPDFIKEITKEIGHYDAVKGAYKTKQKSAVARFIQYEYEDRYDKLKKEKEIDYFDSCAVAIKKKHFDMAGGFDERYREPSCEDQDLSFKLSKMGCKIGFNPKAIVYHLHPESILKYFKRKFKVAYWKALIIKEHPDKLPRDSYTPFRLKFQVLLFPIFLLSIVVAFFVKKLWFLPLIILAIFYLTEVPFLLKLIVKDFRTALVAPVMLFCRWCAHFAGLTRGGLRLLFVSEKKR